MRSIDGTIKLDSPDGSGEGTEVGRVHGYRIRGHSPETLYWADAHSGEAEGGPGSPTELNGLRGQLMDLDLGVIAPGKVVPERLES